jgi:hypothetical protein
VDEQRLTGIEVRAQCGEAEPDDLFVCCRALVQPALEDAMGFPPWTRQASASGLRRARLDTRPRSHPKFLVTMNPLDVTSISTSIDAADSLAEPGLLWAPNCTLRKVVLRSVSRSAQGRRRRA